MSTSSGVFEEVILNNLLVDIFNNLKKIMIFNNINYWKIIEKKICNGVIDSTITKLPKNVKLDLSKIFIVSRLIYIISSITRRCTKIFYKL